MKSRRGKKKKGRGFSAGDACHNRMRGEKKVEERSTAFSIIEKKVLLSHGKKRGVPS